MKKLNTYKSKNLLCGIDGGGTSSKVLICDLSGEILLSFEAESINHYGTSITKVNKCFAAIAKKIYSYFTCLPSIIYVGNSALSDKADQKTISELTGGAFGTSKVFFHSDVYIALLGSTFGKSGAILVAGTGSMACGIVSKGNFHTVGGWGQTLGDEGSAYHIALQAVKAAIHGHEGTGEKTILTKNLIDHFELKHLHDLINIVYNPPIEKSKIAAFAIKVNEAAIANDKIALRILKEEATYLYKLAIVITKACKTNKIAYTGSVLTQNKLVRLHLKRLLKKQNIELIKPLFKPEIGALIAAFSEASIKIDSSIIHNLSKY